jgi:hypothetical protein
MSAQANVVINDGKTTPVAHTFVPKGARSANGKDVALWRDQASGVAAGYLSLTEQHSKTNANGIEKFRFVIEVPTLEQAASGGSFVPPPTRAYAAIGVVEVWVHERASDAELKDIAAYVKNFSALPYFTNVIVNREAAW